jgi:pseudaminic acid cytidylyltransferase
VIPSNSHTVAIITARGGSKRIPGKNIRLLHGKPLIVWTIENLLSSQIFQDIVVSTDSEEIIEIAKRAGARVPFIRPSHLADDFTSTAEVADHAIRRLIDEGAPRNSFFCVVYPAAVGLTEEDFREALAVVARNEADLVFGASEFPSHPARGWRVNDNSLAVPADPKNQSMRSQDLPAMYFDAGQFYWSRYDTWRRIASGEEVRRKILVLPRSRAIDIDTEEDWALAELVYRELPVKN